MPGTINCKHQTQTRKLNAQQQLMKKKNFLLLIGFIIAASAVNAQRYKLLHGNAIVVDTHNDILSSATMEGLNIEKKPAGQNTFRHSAV